MVPDNDNQSRYKPADTLTPSDNTLDRSWRALQPGNYKPRTDLNKYKHPLIKDLEKHKSEIPVGVADENSAVFIYQQGTIEIIGKVYCWNKLVKPGIYSPFEKLRYIAGNEIVPNRDPNRQHFHHASYNKFSIPANPFLSKGDYADTDALRYHFVSFDEQVVTKSGEKIYPIPIINGRLTIYPDGSFKTQGIVIESKENRFIDQYGYLADQDNYATVKSYYDNITKDDVNPKNVYRIISENEDGSITYGPIEANETLSRTKWIPLPDNIIPVNDGKVSVNDFGEVELSGLVITGYGHRILRDRFKIQEFYDNILSSDWVDLTEVYNPVGYSLYQNKFQPVVLDIVNVDNPVETYKYHYYKESYKVNTLERGQQLVFSAMPGWRTFTTNSPVKGSLNFLKEQITGYPENRDVDFSKYPWVNHNRVVIGGVYRYPYVRYNPKGEIDSYVTIDHYPEYWHFQDISNVNYNVANFRHQDHDGLDLKLDEKQPNYLTYPRYKNVELLFDENKVNRNKFIPYNGGKIWFTKNDNGQVEVNIQGPVLWKRAERYYRLGLEDFTVKNNLNKVYTCLYDDSWPDIVEDKDGNIVSLFTVNGYFKDEPVFIKRKHAVNSDHIGNELTTIRGWKRQEEGLFKLVERDVTYYLTDYEKTLINNLHGQYRSFTIDEKNVNIVEHHNYYINVDYTAEQTGLILDYQAIRFNDILPNWFNPTYFHIDGYSDTGANRNMSYERAKQVLVPYRTLRLALFPNNEDRSPKLEILIHSGQNITMSNKFQPVEFEIYRSSRELYSITKNITEVPYKDKILYLDKVSEQIKEGDITTPVQQVSYLNRTLLNLPRNWVLEQQDDIIPGASTTRNTLILYRYYNDTKLISGTVTTDNDGQFNIPCPPLMDTKKGYIEVWLDDPFGVNKEGIRNTSYYFINLRNNNVLDPIIIDNPDSIDTQTIKITGIADAEAKVFIALDGVDQGVILNVAPDGTWEWDCDLSLVQVGTIITATEKKEGFPSQSTEATVKEHLWKNGDFITPRQLFGDATYMIPYNIRHKDNLDNVPNHVDSALTINPMNQTYTIHGVLMSINGNTIYPEGTYSIGQKPSAYVSKIITQDHVTSKIIQYTKEHPTEPNVYRVGTTYKGSKNEPIKLPETMVDIGNDELWHYPRSWLTEWNTLLNDDTVKDLPYFKVLANWFTAKDILATMKIVRKEGSIGRFQNRIVIDEYLRFETELKDELYLAQRAILAELNGDYSGYRREGYSPLELYHLLLINEENVLYKPWWLNIDKLGYPENVTDPIIRNARLPDHQSYTRPINWEVLSIATSTDSRAYTYEGNEWLVPTRFTQPYSMSLYHIRNWDKIVSFNDYRQEPYFIYYSNSYGYVLDKNYTDMNPPMNERVKDYWTKKGFDPNMFVFDKRKTPGTKIIYHRNGKSIDVNGRTKIGGRYTRNIPQPNILEKHEIQFIHACPDAYLPHGDLGTVTLTDNDELLLTGIVYGLDCIDGEIRDRTLLEDRLEPKVIKVSSLNTDITNRDWNWVTNRNQYMEIEIGNIDQHVLNSRLKVKISVSSIKSSEFIFSWEETLTFDDQGAQNNIFANVRTYYDPANRTIKIFNTPNWNKTQPLHGVYNYSSDSVERYFELGVQNGDWSTLDGNVLITEINLYLTDENGVENTIDTFTIKNGFKIETPIVLRFNNWIENHEGYVINKQWEEQPYGDMYRPRTFLVQIEGSGLIDLIRIPLQLQIKYSWSSSEKINPDDPDSGYRPIETTHTYPFKIDLTHPKTEVLVNEPNKAIVRIRDLNLRDAIWGDKQNDPWLIVPGVNRIEFIWYNLNENYTPMPVGQGHLRESYICYPLYTFDRDNTPEDIRYKIAKSTVMYKGWERQFSVGWFFGNTKSEKDLSPFFGTNGIRHHGWKILDSDRTDGWDNPRNRNYPYGWRNIEFKIENFPRFIDKDTITFNLHSVCYNYIHFSENDGVVYDTPIPKDEHFSLEIDENWTATVRGRIRALGGNNYPLPKRKNIDVGKVWTDNSTYQTAEHYIEFQIPNYDKIQLSGTVDTYWFYHRSEGRGNITKVVVKDVENTSKTVNVLKHPRQFIVDIEGIPVEHYLNEYGDSELNISMTYEAFVEDNHDNLIYSKSWNFNKNDLAISNVQQFEDVSYNLRWDLGILEAGTPLAREEGYRPLQQTNKFRFSHSSEIAPYLGKNIIHQLRLRVGEHVHVFDITSEVEYIGKNVKINIEQPSQQVYNSSLYSPSDYVYTFENVNLEDISTYEFTIMSGQYFIEKDGTMTITNNEGIKTTKGTANKYTYRIDINDPSVVIEKNDSATKTIVIRVKWLNKYHPFLAKYKDDPWLITPRMDDSDHTIYYQLNNGKPLLNITQ